MSEVGWRPIRNVFPTHVGVNLVFKPFKPVLVSFPHARGGEPFIKNIEQWEELFSPRTWG